MTRDEVSALLRGFIRELRINPQDAAGVFDQVPADGVDSETLGDYLDGAGYPELAEVAYTL
jgi:hypothetical protein